MDEEISSSGEETSRRWTFDAYRCWNRVHSLRSGALRKNYQESIRSKYTPTAECVETLTNFSSLVSQTSGGKHFTRGARLERLRQTSPRAGSSRDLEQLASETADAFALSSTRFAAMVLTISSSPQHRCAILDVVCRLLQFTTHDQRRTAKDGDEMESSKRLAESRLSWGERRSIM